MVEGKAQRLGIPDFLHNGYRRFRSERYAREVDRYRTVARGQKPSTMVISCIDSRVDPATIFSAGPGELLVVRNVAALVPPYEELVTYHGTWAALEFAVCVLQVSNIVVMGHGMCGGVEAALTAAESGPVGRFIGPWVELLADVRDEIIEKTDLENNRQRVLEQTAVRQSLENIMSFSFISEAVNEGRLMLHGAWFSIAEGELLWLNKESEEFELVAK